MDKKELAQSRKTKKPSKLQKYLFDNGITKMELRRRLEENGYHASLSTVCNTVNYRPKHISLEIARIYALSLGLSLDAFQKLFNA